MKFQNFVIFFLQITINNYHYEIPELLAASIFHSLHT